MKQTRYYFSVDAIFFELLIQIMLSNKPSLKKCPVCRKLHYEHLYEKHVQICTAKHEAYNHWMKRMENFDKALPLINEYSDKSATLKVHDTEGNRTLFNEYFQKVQEVLNS